MLIIPAIDIKGGKCVRLKQGDPTQEVIYYEDPLACAAHWQEQGASRVHLVDLDGAFSGTRVNLATIKDLVTGYPELKFQVGGGLRRREDVVHYLAEVQVDYVIIGTLALKAPELIRKLAAAYPQRIYLAVDLRDDRVHNQGWTAASDLSVSQLLAKFAGSQLAGLLVTDIKNDGMLRGLDAALFTQLAAATEFPVIAAGGVTTLQDIQALNNSKQIYGVICGKSIYEQTLDLRAAINLVQEAPDVN